MLKTILISVVVIGVLLGVGVAWAKHRGYCNDDNRAHFVTQRLTHKLDLTTEQQMRLSALVDKFSELRNEAADRKDKIRVGIVELLSTPALDRDRASALLEEGLRPLAERKRELIDSIADFTDSLHPEQRTQLTGLIDDRLVWRWGRHRWAH